MGATACGLVAGLIDWIEGPRSDQGRPRCATEAVIETRRFFLREGVQWRELQATRPPGHQGSGLRRDAAAAPHGLERGSPAASGARHARSDGALGARSRGRSMGCGHRRPYAPPRGRQFHRRAAANRTEPRGRAL